MEVAAQIELSEADKAYIESIGIDEARKRAIDADACAWALSNKIILPDGNFVTQGREYLIEPMTSQGQFEVTMKASQGGFPLCCNTPIPTPDGWVLMGEIKKGQKVFGSDGEVYQTTAVHRIHYGNKCYRVVFSDGSSIVCDENHMWKLTDEWHRRYIKEVVIKTSEIVSAKKRNRNNRYAINVAAAIKMPEIVLPIEPYLLGLWLGDGHRYSMLLTGLKEDLNDYCKYIKEEDYTITPEKRFPRIARLFIRGFQERLRNSGLYCNKHIPIIYLRASYNQRLSLLQGLMDTDGHITKKGKCEFYNINYLLIENVYELLMSLGIKAKIAKKGRTKNWDKTELTNNMLYRITFRAYEDQPVCRLPRKMMRQKDKEKGRPSETNRRRIVRVEEASSVPVRCITVNSPDHLFLAGKSFITVHNTMGETLVDIHGCAHGLFPKGIIYSMPTDTDVQTMSKTKWNPLIADNPKSIGRYVQSSGRGGTDSADLKKIGRSYIYFLSAMLKRGDTGEKTSSTLKSRPCDKFICDEFDEMDPDVLEKLRSRYADSEIKQERIIANPLSENSGSHKLFKQSTQRHWWRLCPHCLKWFCPDKEFFVNPDKIITPECKNGIILCLYCGKPTPPFFFDKVTRKTAGYQADYGDRRWIGRHWSHLNSVRSNAWDVLQDYLNPPEGNFGDVMRAKLGRPYTSKEEQLRPADVMACCGREPMVYSHAGPCIMSFDVMTNINYVVGFRTGKETFEVIKFGTVPNFKDAYDMAKKFNVKVAGIDPYPDIHAAKTFQADLKSIGCKAFLVDYRSSRNVGNYGVDEVSNTIKANRTEAMDQTHNMVIKKQFVFPRQEQCEEFIKQLCDPFKYQKTNEKTGLKEFLYKGSGEDHYRHCLNYLVLAAKCGRARTIKPRGFTRQTKCINEG